MAIVWSAVITGIIAFALEKTVGWRVTEAQEVGGTSILPTRANVLILLYRQLRPQGGEVR